MRTATKAGIVAGLLGLLALSAQASAAIKPPAPKPPTPEPPGPSPLPPFVGGGAAWLRSLPNKEHIPSRERAILEAVWAGYHVPLRWAPVDCSRDGHKATIWVTTDAIQLGKVGDSVRVCVSALTAQLIADHWGASLQTTRTSDLSYAQADVNLEPQTMGPGSSSSLEAMIAHSLAIDAVSPPESVFMRDVGKDVVLSNKLLDGKDVYRGRLANYGWHSPSAPHKGPTGEKVWQALATAHPDGFANDSMTLCLVQGGMLVDGQDIAFIEVARHPDLHRLVSDEGPLRIVRYPTVAPPGLVA